MAFDPAAAFDAERFRREGRAVIDWLADYWQSLPEKPVLSQDALAASGLFWLLSREREQPVDPRRTALRGPRRAGDALGDVAGVHGARNPHARLAPRTARPARAVCEPRTGRGSGNTRRRRDPGFRVERPALHAGRRAGTGHGAGDECPRRAAGRSAARRLCERRRAFERREGGHDRRNRPRLGAADSNERAWRDGRRGACPHHGRRCPRRPRSLLRGCHGRHHGLRRHRSGAGDRHSRPPARRLAPRRRRLGGSRRGLPGIPRADRRRRPTSGYS